MSQLIPISTLTDKVTAMYRKHFMDFFRYLLWLLVPVVLASLLTLLPISSFTRGILDAALAIIITIISLWLSVVFIDMIVGFLGHRSQTKVLAKKSWGMWGRVIDLVLVSLLQAGVVLLGFLLFIIPGIVFAVWFSFARYAVLVDGSSPGAQALRLSKELVSKRFWPLLWRWVGAYVYYGLFLVLGGGLLLVIIGAILGNPGAAFVEASVQAPWWSELIVGTISVLATPIFIGVGVALYESAKQTR